MLIKYIKIQGDQKVSVHLKILL